jgi:hypothetical protein
MTRHRYLSCRHARSQPNQGAWPRERGRMQNADRAVIEFTTARSANYPVTGTHDHVNDSGFHWPAAPSPRRIDPMKDPMSERASAMDK